MSNFRRETLLPLDFFRLRISLQRRIAEELRLSLPTYEELLSGIEETKNIYRQAQSEGKIDRLRELTGQYRE